MSGSPDFFKIARERGLGRWNRHKRRVYDTQAFEEILEESDFFLDPMEVASVQSSNCHANCFLVHMKSGGIEMVETIGNDWTEAQVFSAIEDRWRNFMVRNGLLYPWSEPTWQTPGEGKPR